MHTSMSRKKMNENVPYFPRFPSSHTLFESRVKKTESSGACSTGKLMARPNVEERVSSDTSFLGDWRNAEGYEEKQCEQGV